MLRMGLSAADLRTYNHALLRPHERRITAEIQTLNGSLLRSLSLQVLDGQVDVDTTAEISRVLDLTFIDPSRSLQFEPDNPGGAPLHRSRRIHVGYSIRVPELEQWVTCPVFTGPIWDFKRQGAEVSITAHGMERQALGNQWHPRTFAKKTKKTRALKAIAADVGYTRVNIPDLNRTFPGRFTVARMDQQWPKMRRVAQSLDRHLFFDGSGVLWARAYPNRPVFTFDEALLSEPFVLRDVEGLRNIVEVVGAKPKGAKHRVHAVAALPPSNDLSPESLGIDAAHPLYLAERVENGHLKTKADCFAHARRIRDDRVRVTTQLGWDSVPIPHLDEMDWVQVVGSDGTFMARMQKWSIPLGGSMAGGTEGPPMTVGYHRRTTKARHRQSSHNNRGMS